LRNTARRGSGKILREMMEYDSDIRATAGDCLQHVAVLNASALIHS
jgi:hypothetical protein